MSIRWRYEQATTGTSGMGWGGLLHRLWHRQRHSGHLASGVPEFSDGPLFHRSVPPTERSGSDLNRSEFTLRVIIAVGITTA